MDCAETVTSAGRARWGYRDADIALSTISRTWHSRDGSDHQTVVSYRLSYRLLSPQPWGPDVREFSTEGERIAFLDAGISGWRDRPESAAVLQRWSPRFERWRKTVVDRAEVEAGSGNVVLTIGPEQVRLELLPDIRRQEGTLQPGSTEYESAVRDLAGQSIDDVDVFLDDGFVIQTRTAELVIPNERVWGYHWPGEVEEAIGGHTIPPDPAPSRDIAER